MNIDTNDVLIIRKAKRWHKYILGGIEKLFLFWKKKHRNVLVIFNIKIWRDVLSRSTSSFYLTSNYYSKI